MSWQPWAVTWKPQALDDLRRIDRATAGRVVAAMDRYAASGHGYAIPLKGGPDEWRLRVGGWRVIFTRQITDIPAEENEGQVGEAQAAREVDRRLVVLAVRPRGGAYRDR